MSYMERIVKDAVGADRGISKVDAKVLVRQVRYKFSEMFLHERSELVASLSAQGNNFLEYSRFVKETPIEEKAHRLFYVLAKGRSEISNLEFKILVRKVYKVFTKLSTNCGKVSGELLAIIFQEIDEKDDGVVDVEEFSTGFCKGHFFMDWLNFLYFEQEEIDPNENENDAFKMILVFFLSLLRNLDGSNSRKDFYNSRPLELLNAIELPVRYTSVSHALNELEVRLGIDPRRKKLELESHFQAGSPKNASIPDIFKSSLNIFYCPTTIFLLVTGLNLYFSKISAEPIHLLYSDRSTLKCFKLKPFSVSTFETLHTIFSLPSLSAEFSICNLIESYIQSEFSMSAWIKSPGKSGSLFYISTNSRYLLKTLRDNEFNFLQSILQPYAAYMSLNKSSFITQLLGLFKVSNDATKGEIVVLANLTFPLHNEPQAVYDLKGSTYGRNSKNTGNNFSSMLDLDFEASGTKIDVPAEVKAQILSQIQLDISFLESLRIIDYSLLVSIHTLTETSRCLPRPRNSYLSSCGTFLYTLGLIDILSEFTLKKQLESLIKLPLMGPGVTCLPPTQYSARFLSYITSIFS